VTSCRDKFEENSFFAREFYNDFTKNVTPAFSLSDFATNYTSLRQSTVHKLKEGKDFADQVDSSIFWRTFEERVHSFPGRATAGCSGCYLVLGPRTVALSDVEFYASRSVCSLVRFAHEERAERR
jgi:hypothetical protein